jgi:RND family efflux transporter MFP subunit
MLWMGVGVVLTAAAFFALGPRSPARSAAEPEAGSAARAERAAGAEPREASRPAAPDCYVAVVLASEKVDVVAEIEGHLEGVLLDVGDTVEHHQRLAVVNSEDLRHQLAIERANLANARARRRRTALQVDQADQEHRRRLALEGILSEEQTEASKFELDTARAELEIAEAELAQVAARIEQLEATLEKSEIRSPFDGTVALRYLDVGAKVVPGTPVLQLISSAELVARFAVPPEAAARVAIGAPVRVELEDFDRVFAGSVVHRAPEIDAVSQMMFMEALLSPGAGPAIPAGAVARVSVIPPGEAPPACLDRPQSARGPSSTRTEGTSPGAASRSRP